MDPQNHGNGSSPLKRKRGRPRKDKSIVRSEQVHAMPESEKMKDTKKSTDPNVISRDEIVGQGVYGVIDGKFDAGYLVKVRVGNTDIHLKGVVFLPGRVVPVTAANDLAPQARMYERTDIPLPVPNLLSQKSQVSSSAQINKPIEHKELASTIEGYGQPFEVRNPVSRQNQCASAVLPFTNNLAANQGGFSLERKVESPSVSLGSGMLHDEASEEKKALQKSTSSVKKEKAECVETTEPTILESQSSHCGKLPIVDTVDRKVQAKHQLASSDLEATQVLENELKSPTIDHGDTQVSAMDIEAPELARKVVIGDNADYLNREPLGDAANVTTAKSLLAPLNKPSASNLSGGYTLASTTELVVEGSTLEGVIAPQLSFSFNGTDIMKSGLDPTSSTPMEIEVVPSESKLDIDGPVPTKMTECE